MKQQDQRPPRKYIVGIQEDEGFEFVLKALGKKARLPGVHGGKGKGEAPRPLVMETGDKRVLKKTIWSVGIRSKSQGGGGGGGKEEQS